jgi:carboxypeptidase family protein
MPSARAIWMSRWLAVVSLCLMCATLVPAQGTGGRILGRVSDPSGAVLANVKVTATNEATGVSRDTKTNASGDYVFPEVPVGTYTLSFDLSGFKTNVRKGVTLQLNQVITLNMAMQIGQTKEIVEVTSEAPLVDTTSTQLGAVVNDRAVNQLPLNQRDTYQFLQLQPGVVSPFAAGTGGNIVYGSDQTGAVSVNGGRGRSNNFSVNGGDANDQFVNLPAIQPTPDSIEEFRVLSNTFDAEYGRNSGSVVNVVTKSGTNALHGNVYEFFRNDKLNARNFFELTRPEFRQNQFGGTLGGPIKKDRTFFFLSYEGRRIRKPSTGSIVPVPTAAERPTNSLNGQVVSDFSEGFVPGDPNFPTFSGSLTNSAQLTQRSGCQAAVTAIGGGAINDGVSYQSIFPNNQIPIACMDPVAVDLLQLVPQANRPDGVDFQGTEIGRVRGDQATLRLDHRINNQQNLNVYYYFNDDHAVQPFAFFQFAGANVPGFGSIVEERFQQWNLSHTWTLNPNTVNEARFTYLREGQRTFQHPQHTTNVIDSCPPSLPGQPAVTTGPTGNCFNDPSNPALGITPNLGPSREGLPFIQLSGGFVIGNNSEGELPQVGNSFQWSDNLTKVKGTHTLKFGGDVRRMRFDQTLFFDVSGEYFYFGGGPNDTGFQNFYPNYLLGLPDEYGQGAAQHENVRSTALYLFAQDSWKIKPNLTLNYGLRWELTTPIADIGHRVQTFRPGQQDTVFPCVIGSVGAQELGVAPGTSCAPGSDLESVFPTGLVVPGDKGVPNALTQTYYKAFAPRIGLAWSPGHSGKTSIRSGFGLFYNPIEQLVLEQFSAEPPFGGSSFVFNTQFNTPFLGQDPTITNPNPFNGILNPQHGQNVDWSVFRPILLFGEFQPHMRTQYTAQYNLTIQRELTKDLVLQVGYVGTQAHRLLATHDINFGNSQTCLDLNNISNLTGDANLACGPFFADSPFFIPAGEIPAGVTLHMPYGSQSVVTGPNATDINLVGLRPFSSPKCDPFSGSGCPPDGIPVFSNIFAQDTVANSAYNSLQISLEKRFSHGLQLQGAYTYSKSFDQASSFENLLNPINPRLSRSLSLFDARNRFVLSYYWEPPVPKYTGAKGKLLDGWALSGIVTLQSGFPIRITSQADNELISSFDFETVGEPDQLKPFKRQNAHNGGCALGTGPSSLEGAACNTVPNLYFDPNTFTENPDVVPSLLGRFGNAPRTICCGPGIRNFDFSVQKNIPVTESTRLEFRAEFFNAFNHTMFLNPDGNTTDGSTFGEVTQARDPRLVQFALKLFF